MPISIKQEVVLNASPAEVYSALMDSRKHGAFTGVPDKRIVQSWRGAQWKPGE
jgi:uncharacterized protein YndB with AHSA1/START domain